jgi:emp24/gp25L/p24 family/GOLD
VKDPRDVVILDGKQERQGDYILTANHVGEYAFCFENDMSTITEKLVDFDIMVCGLFAIIQLLIPVLWHIGRKRTEKGNTRQTFTII